MNGIVSAESLLAVVFLALVGMAITAWAHFWKKRAAGLPLEEFRSRQPVPWGLIDLFIVAVIYVGLQSVALMICLGPEMQGAEATEDLNLSEQLPLMLMFSAASLLTLVVGLVFVSRRTGATLVDFGLSPRQWISDLSVGALLFSLMIVPIFGIQWLLQLMADEPSHPLIKMLMESSSPAFFAASGFVAVIVAPIVEEFLFRVLLQGWLENLTIIYGPERATLSDPDRQRLIVGGRRPFENGAPMGGDGESAPEEGGVPASEMRRRGQYIETSDVNPFASPVAAMSEGSEPNSGEESSLIDSANRIRPSWWPIVGSAIVFALAHFGHGTDPIPLFIFALGLGWLYQRTHRMWPCVVVHMMLNGLSMMQLFLFLQSQTP